MELLESVLLTYENKNRLQYQSLAEFLRLLGVFVCEDLRLGPDSKPYYDWKDQDYQYQYTVLASSEDANFEAMCKVFQDIDLECFNELYAIYKEYSLLQQSVTLQYYRMKHEVVEKAGEEFIKAANSISSMIESKPEYLECPHVRYAKLYCKQKANLAFFLCEEQEVYCIDDLAGEDLQLINDVPQFTNVWVLLGLIYEISRDYVKDALDAFNHAIDMVKDKSYVASIYYWLGRRCEEHSSLKKLRNEAYLAAYNSMPKYRNEYKIARGYLNQKELEKALEYFKRCLKRIEAKGNYLDPLEQEYYFKIKVHICYIYLQIEDYYQVIVNGKQVLEFKGKIEEKEEEYVKFYLDMYGVDGEIYIDMTLERLNLQQLYRYLALAYQESDMQEMAMKYWKLYRM